MSKNILTDHLQVAVILAPYLRVFRHWSFNAAEGYSRRCEPHSGAPSLDRRIGSIGWTEENLGAPGIGKAVRNDSDMGHKYQFFTSILLSFCCHFQYSSPYCGQFLFSFFSWLCSMVCPCLPQFWGMSWLNPRFSQCDAASCTAALLQRGEIWISGWEDDAPWKVRHVSFQKWGYGYGSIPTRSCKYAFLGR